MKFLLLIHNNVEALEKFSEQELMEMAGGPAAVAATARELLATGELVSVLGLLDPGEERDIQLVSGTPVISDRPLLETKEFLAGAMVLNCATVERALEIAARIPLADFRRVEFREIRLDQDDFLNQLGTGPGES
ncbi:YciI family protein [Kribbella sp.]|uniref:YciI family protein n=1 Tax=Kribbella sp. TaxID=1871183 RepID=UPI002D67CA29|nr:YciI family protein [Kribbella sp.]HZX08050.1 YciI family protein [Kribbella sp.]